MSSRTCPHLDVFIEYRDIIGTVCYSDGCSKSLEQALIDYAEQYGIDNVFKVMVYSCSFTNVDCIIGVLHNDNFNFTELAKENFFHLLKRLQSQTSWIKKIQADECHKTKITSDEFLDNLNNKDLRYLRIADARLELLGDDVDPFKYDCTAVVTLELGKCSH